MSIELIHGDRMDVMATYPDKYFDLAVVDPPYGIGESGGKCRTRLKHNNKVKHIAKNWDDERPAVEYWDELFRVSKNQVIWGANYFTKFLPPSMGWIFWDKGQRDFSLADGELAWTSFNKALRVFDFSRAKLNQTRAGFHPTQKPVALYKWLLAHYAKQGDLILDTHLGSGSSAIAAHKHKLDFVGIEIDKDYYDAAVKRFNLVTSQTTLF